MSALDRWTFDRRSKVVIHNTKRYLVRYKTMSGRMKYSRGVFRTATEAETFGQAVIERYERLKAMEMQVA